MNRALAFKEKLSADTYESRAYKRVIINVVGGAAASGIAADQIANGHYVYGGIMGGTAALNVGFVGRGIRRAASIGAYERQETARPDAWRPGVFSHYNSKALRTVNVYYWAEQAHKQNKARSLGEKVLFRNIITSENIMRDEANTMNAALDAGELPPAIYDQRRTDRFFELAGIQERHFPTVEALQDAIRQSPEIQGEGSYHTVMHRAYEIAAGIAA